MGHVFLSYARRNSEFADRLVTALERRGLKVWLDRSDIPGGAAWDASISEALQDAVAVVVVLSPDALKSEHVVREVALAGDYGQRIIPVEYVPTPPMSAVPARTGLTHAIAYRLAGLQWIDFVHQDFERAVDRVVEALTANRA